MGRMTNNQAHSIQNEPEPNWWTLSTRRVTWTRQNTWACNSVSARQWDWIEVRWQAFGIYAVYFPLSSSVSTRLLRPISSALIPLLSLPHTSRRPAAHLDANSRASTRGEILNRDGEEASHALRSELAKEDADENTKRWSWESQSARDWAHCNISSSKLQQAAIEEKKKALNCVNLFQRVKSRRWDQTGLWYFCHV